MDELKFQNPIFRRGLMQTVRKGREWWGATGFVDLVDGHGNLIGTGRIISSALYYFNKIPQKEISMSHDPNCQYYSGLLKAMKTFYPDFKEENEVTLIWFYKEGVG